MSFFTLPTELLIIIFKLVGAEEFRARLELLTVCKPWLRFAQMVMVENLAFSSKTMDQFPPVSESARILISENMISLSINLSDFSSSKTSRDIARRPLCIGEYVSNMKSAHDAWTSKVDNRLRDLGVLLSSCKKLRQVDLVAFTLHDPLMSNFTWPREPNLLNSSITYILSPNYVRGLTHLFIDTAGRLIEDEGGLWSRFHTCSLIAKNFHTLRVLHVRLKNICPEILNTKKYTQRPPIEELIIALNNHDMYGSPMMQGYTHRCSRKFRALDMTNQKQHLLKDLADAAFAIAPTLPRIRLLQIDQICGLSGERVRTVDCITGKSIVYKSRDDIEGETEYDLSE
ncbi:hypothetical protein AOQ84DRAFT_425834 [Glonium stellatum]|uniref:F-box domain-containing protein n=1 Tax=Glonium stellatum TaxID=574774 RepID=A0A8E2F5C4_9PEZI|nr:hypothetical protein AOQ84DRAFT_425834 [Glonium stellatum]